MGDDAESMAEDFYEDLPSGANQCPPAEALNTALDKVWRLIPTLEPDEDTFLSLYALGETKPDEYDVSDCDFASCSLRNNRDALLRLKGLRRRNPYIAELTIPAGSGRHTTGGTHVNFWKYASFKIVGAIVSLEPHNLS